MLLQKAQFCIKIWLLSPRIRFQYDKTTVWGKRSETSRSLFYLPDVNSREMSRDCNEYFKCNENIKCSHAESKQYEEWIRMQSSVIKVEANQAAFMTFWPHSALFPQMSISWINPYRFFQFLPEVVVFLLKLSGVGNSLHRQQTTYTGVRDC